MAESELPLVVAITGASGSVYALKLLQTLAGLNLPVHLVVSETGEKVMQQETGRDINRWLADFGNASLIIRYDNRDFYAPMASGSFRHRGMVVIPCSMGTLGRVSSGVSGSLLERAADVCLKERRPLILVARETPLSSIHLENMLKLSRAGAVILPPVPAFYSAPSSIDDIVDQTVHRIADILELPIPGAFRWGSPQTPRE